MKAVVFSGTTEGRRFSKKLAELGVAVTVCVATPLGAEEQGEMAGITVHAGRLQPDAMAALLAGADLCVDATHPYAVDATRNIRAAAVQAGVEYRRLLRAQSPLPPGCAVFETAAQAAEYLAGTEGNILLATGAKELAVFAGLEPARLYPRVLPTPEGIAACEAANVPPYPLQYQLLHHPLTGIQLRRKVHLLQPAAILQPYDQHNMPQTEFLLSVPL